MKYFILLILFSIPIIASGECILTDEYKTARKDVYFKAKAVHSSYKECRGTMQAAYYWKAVAACTQKGLGKEIGGGCAHIVSQGSFPVETIDHSHCEIFKVPKRTEHKYRDKLLLNLNIAKCKTISHSSRTKNSLLFRSSTF